ncbi:hypothetical protein DFH07DRAFT_818688 [Mycena maculata]|uniref:C3H1-type domain-containing protein n=1 Tax=Mycena maculata TaxID=230809 RepID=A0AAD7J6F6_9AGAR|nr:hypothetical protein DFH07DRAFT_818688 [Mycena maculata]
MSEPAAPSSPKRPPQKKRHTKPCRYFQVGCCPHAAQEDCDFAHVFSDQAVLLPPPKQCRYYLQGNCTNGIWCQYRHGEAVSEEQSLLQDSQNVNSFSGFCEIGLGPDAFQMHVGVPPAVYIPPASNRMYAAPTPWSPYADGFYSPIELVPPPHLYLKPTISPAESLDSIECVTPSSSPTSSVSDDGMLPDDAAGHQYPYFSPQIQVGGPYVRSPYSDDVCMSPFPSHSPPMPLSVVPTPYGMAPMYEIFSPKGPPSAGFYAPILPSTPQSPRTPINRQKLANYRTKPCRYFKPGSVCPNGDACTFIHADPESSDAPQAPPPSPVNKLQHELPSKPLSSKEQNIRKGYFPISWRVIGGGVRLSSAPTGCSLSDDDESDLSEESCDFAGRADPVSRVLEIEVPASAPPSAVAFPSDVNATADTEESTTPTGLPFRQRASSIPTTPLATHVDMLRVRFICRSRKKTNE